MEGLLVEVNLEVLLWLLAAATLAGFIDSICGGGGLVGVPALLLAGVPPAQALGTNKLQAMFGKLSALRYFRSQNLVSLRQLKWPLVVCFTLSFCGAWVVQWLDSQWLLLIMPWLIGAAALYVLFSPVVQDQDQPSRTSPLVYATWVLPLLAFYDGFFGPASGAFFTLSLMALLGLGAARATAHAKAYLLVSNFAALLAFAIGGQVLWALGLIMAAGQWIGAHYGAKAVVLKGSQLVKPMLVIVSLCLSARLAWQQLV